MNEPERAPEILLKFGCKTRSKTDVRAVLGENILARDKVDRGSDVDRVRFIKLLAKACPTLPESEIKKARAQLADEDRFPPEVETRAQAEGDADHARYAADESGTHHLKYAANGHPEAQLLANFSARILADVQIDDGSGIPRREFEIAAKLGDSTFAPFRVPAERFAGMGWVPEKLGARAIVEPGYGATQHLRTAIQTLSAPDSRSVYAHTGWRCIDGRHVYLHGGGAIGAAGPVEGIEVELPDQLREFVIPAPPQGKDLELSILSFIRLQGLGPGRVTIPIVAAVVRAPLGPTTCSLYLVGSTGTYKTALAAIAQSCWGQGITAEGLLSWTSTANTIESLQHGTKDALLVIDDFVPAAGIAADRQLAQADRVFRGAGNRSGRGRMRADGSLRPTLAPRCLLLGTGEEVPRGQSLQARLVVVEIGKGDIDVQELSAAQEAAGMGRLAAALAGYIQWLAVQQPGLEARVRAEERAVRDELTELTGHRRMPSQIASLLVGYRSFLRFATETRTITAREAEKLEADARAALTEVAVAQAVELAAQDPAPQFLRLLASALAGGHAHIATKDGGQPRAQIHALGWWDGGTEWHPRGPQVGWVDGETLYLEPDLATGAASELGRRGGRPLAISPLTLGKRLHEAGYLTKTDARDGKRRLTCRVSIAETRRSVWALRLTDLFTAAGGPPDPQQPDADPGPQGKDEPCGS